MVGNIAVSVQLPGLWKGKNFACPLPMTTPESSASKVFAEFILVDPFKIYLTRVFGTGLVDELT